MTLACPTCNGRDIADGHCQHCDLFERARAIASPAQIFRRARTALAAVLGFTDPEHTASDVLLAAVRFRQRRIAWLERQLAAAQAQADRRRRHLEDLGELLAISDVAGARTIIALWRAEEVS